MRTIRYTNKFKRDYKRQKSGKSRHYAQQLDRALTKAVVLLAADAALPRRYVDHPLVGDWKDFRDCHLTPDLILIYRKPDADSLELVRLGSHSELGL
jgi:mRNA interferase YafQ